MTHRPDNHLHRLLVEQGHVPGFVPSKPRKKRSNEESRIQQAVIKWWSLKHREFGVPECLLFAIPNGSRRDKVVGAILKKEGVRAGVPDLFLAAGRRGWHGAFIELKTADGRIADEQRSFMFKLATSGYWTCTCRSYPEATDAISAYLVQ